MTTWASGATFYHIYPLGMLGAPAENPVGGDPVPRIRELIGWTGHLRDLGMDAVYLGPVFQSTRHGYDTTDHFTLDRRLGTDADLRAVVDHLHANGIRVILDAVYHHVGRDHFAFRDLRERGRTRSTGPGSMVSTSASQARSATRSPTTAGTVSSIWSSSTSPTTASASTCSPPPGTGSRRSTSTGSASTPQTSSTATSSETSPPSSARSRPTPGCSAR